MEVGNLPDNMEGKPSEDTSPSTKTQFNFQINKKNFLKRK